MYETIKNDIVRILNSSISLIKSKNYYKLRELSNHIIHNASVFQDEDSISVAVIVYALSKIGKIDPELCESSISLLETASKQMSEDDQINFRVSIKNILEKISKGKKKEYIEEVLQRAQVKKASKIYEHGISLAQVSETFGISRWDLMDYIGKTTINEQFGNLDEVEKKLRFTRSLFK